MAPETVLIADDDPVQLMLTSETLSADGYRVIEAEDGDAATALFLSEKPDMAILDVMMPGQTGFEVCTHIRRHADVNLAKIPVVLVTGLEDEDSVQMAFEVGATTFIAKPVQWSLLGHQVRYLLRSAAMEKELRQAKAMVEEASILKSRLFATLCHELRTPLNGVIGFADVLLGQGLGPIGNPGYLEYAQDIRQCGDDLLAQVNQMLLLSRLEAGLAPLKASGANADLLLEQNAKRFRKAAEPRAVAINVRPLVAPLRLWCDVEILNAGITALVDNAVKFSPFGGIIEVSAEVVDEQVVITVSDQGKGADDAELEKLMRPFSQADSGLDRAHNGLGLGLPIARLAAERHGGRLAISNAPAGGFVASMMLPPSIRSSDRRGGAGDRRNAAA
jgi:signal transduction histidine kinase